MDHEKYLPPAAVDNFSLVKDRASNYSMTLATHSKIPLSITGSFLPQVHKPGLEDEGGGCGGSSSSDMGVLRAK